MDRGLPTTPEFAELLARSIRDARDAAFSIPLDRTGPDAIVLHDQALAAGFGGEASEVRSKLVSTAISGVIAAFAALQDGLAAIEHDVTRDPPPVWSTLVLARAFTESVIMICYLIDPEVDADTRLARVAGALLTDDDNANAFARSFDPQVPAGREWTIAEMRRGGIQIEGKPKRYRVTVGSITISGDYVITEQAKRLLPPGAPEPYRLFSGPGHARPWGLERTAMKVESRYVGEAASLGAALLIVLYALGAWVKAWTGYFGLDGSGALSQIETVCCEFVEAQFEIYPAGTPGG